MSRIKTQSVITTTVKVSPHEEPSTSSTAYFEPLIIPAPRWDRHVMAARIRKAWSVVEATK